MSPTLQAVFAHSSPLAFRPFRFVSRILVSDMLRFHCSLEIFQSAFPKISGKRFRKPQHFKLQPIPICVTLMQTECKKIISEL